MSEHHQKEDPQETLSPNPALGPGEEEEDSPPPSQEKRVDPPLVSVKVRSINPPGRKARRITSSASRKPVTPELKMKRIISFNNRPNRKEEHSETDGAKRKVKWKRSTIIDRKIAYYQSQADGYSIPQTSFRAMVRLVAGDFSTGIRFKNRALIHLQEFVENELKRRQMAAKIIADSRGRMTVTAKDLQTAGQILHLFGSKRSFHLDRSDEQNK